ncbi:MAG: GntR family transcriptional regulator [Anaerolineales bacterium]|nr:GntR family transcriptional regulator [Anaerolineales bacterium]
MKTPDNLQNVYLTKEEYAFELLRTAILDGELKPGEKLVIDRLSDDLGISTIPIRSALQRLDMEGLVEITPHSPARVAPISLDMVAETFALLAALEEVAFVNAALKLTDEGLQPIRDLVEEMGRVAVSGETGNWMDLNIAFHRKIAEQTGMQLLIEFTNRALDQWRRLSHCYFEEVAAERIRQAQREHVEILHLVETKQVNALSALARQHNQGAFQAYQQLMQNMEEEV